MKSVRNATPAAIRLAVVSAADPVDRATRRLVQLPDIPFLVGGLDVKSVPAVLVERTLSSVRLKTPLWPFLADVSLPVSIGDIPTAARFERCEWRPKGSNTARDRGLSFCDERGSAGIRRVDARFIDDSSQAGVDRVRVRVEFPESWNDAP